MNKTEHLLAVLAEEAGEVVQACTKALRFGLDDTAPGKDETNEQAILVEVAHLKAAVKMLGLKHKGLSERQLIASKVAKVTRYMKYAAETRGTLK